VIVEDEQRGANLGFEAVVRSKILSHFIKGKIFLISHGDHSCHSRGIGVFGRIGQTN
jgi:hypothetical protein